jgi:AcrR family transcriptional regulator
MSKQQRSKDTKDSILQTAAECFAQSGYDATGIAEICERAGVSKGAFYHHFPSKQDVFIELVNRRLARLENLVKAGALLVEDSGSTPDQLRRMARMMQMIFDSSDSQVPLFLEFWTQACRDETIRASTLVPYHSYQQFFEELIQRGIDEGTLEPIDAAAGAQVVLSMAVGMFLQGLLDPDGADWGQVAEESIQILLNGLKRRSE